MTWCVLGLVIGLTACPNEPRPLGVVGDVPDPVPDGTEDYPDGDTGVGTGEGPMESQTTTACGGVEPPELPTGDEVLALDGCALRSPTSRSTPGPPTPASPTAAPPAPSGRRPPAASSTSSAR